MIHVFSHMVEKILSRYEISSWLFCFGGHFSQAQCWSTTAMCWCFFSVPFAVVDSLGERLRRDGPVGRSVFHFGKFIVWSPLWPKSLVFLALCSTFWQLCGKMGGQVISLNPKSPMIRVGMLPSIKHFWKVWGTLLKS